MAMGLAEPVGPVDYGPDLARLEALGEDGEVISVLEHDERPQSLPDEGRQQHRPQLPMNASEPSPTGFGADDHERSPGGERPAKASQRPMPSGIEDDVVAMTAVGDVLAGLVDHLIGADRPNEVHLRCAGDAGDLRSEGLGDLHRVGPHASRRADHERAVAAWDTPVVAKTLEGHRGGDRHCGRLRVGQALRLG